MKIGAKPPKPTGIFARPRVAPPSLPSLPPLGSFCPATMASVVAVDQPLSLNSLIKTEKTAHLTCNTTDCELLGKDTNPGYDRDKTAGLPESIRPFREAQAIWDFIRKPSTDLGQIRSRQALLEKLVGYSGLKNIQQLKNTVYLVNDALGVLFSVVEGKYGQKMTVIESYRRNHQNSDSVYQAFNAIERGQEALKNLIPLLTGLDSFLFSELGAALTSHSAAIAHLGRDYFLGDEFRQSAAEPLGRALETGISNLGLFVSFAYLAQTDGYSRAGFDPGKPAAYKRGWLFARKKAGQVLNDSADDQSLTILSGSNMSGKSYFLKQNLFLQLLAQSFGYVPCAEGNFSFYDSFFYLDRASTAPQADLSAFGQEIADWTAAFAQAGERPLFFVDEGFSTTSPEDQYRLLTATALVLRDYGARMFLASHSERFIEKLVADPQVGLYHFVTDVAANGDIAYRHTLAAGPDDSKALVVAQALKLLTSTIDLAKSFLAGTLEKVARRTRPQWRKIVAYTREERAQLKTRSADHSALIQTKPGNSLLRLYSDDHNFKSHWGGSDINTADVLPDSWDDSMAASGWRTNRLDKLKGCLLPLLTCVGRLSSQEVLERRQTFAALAANDRYLEVRELVSQIIAQINWLPALPEVATDGLLTFNTSLNPFPDRAGEDILANIDVMIAFLEMNQIVLGQDFPAARQLANILLIKQLFIRLDKQLLMDQDVREVEAAVKSEGAALVGAETARFFLEFAHDEPDHEALGPVVTYERLQKYLTWWEQNRHRPWYELHTTFYQDRNPNEPFTGLILKPLTPELIDIFRAKAKNEPDAASWGDKITPERTAAYIDYVRHEGDRREKLVQQKLRPALRHHPNFDFSAAKMVHFFQKEARDEPAKARWGGQITRRRIQAYLNWLRGQGHTESQSDTIHRLDKYQSTVEFAQRGLSVADPQVLEWVTTIFPELQGERITRERLRDHAWGYVDVFRHPERVFAAKPLFLCDLPAITPQLRVIIAHIKINNRYQDYDQINEYSEAVRLAIILEMMLEGEGVFDRLCEVLKSYDSVPLHQLANGFSQERRRFLGLRNFTEAAALFGKLRDRFNEQLRAFYQELIPVEQTLKSLALKYPMRDLPEALKYKYLDTLLAPLAADQLPVDLDRFFQDFSCYTQRGGHSFKAVESNIETAQTPRGGAARFQAFYQQELVESGLLAELREIQETVQAHHDHVVALAGRHHIAFNRVRQIHEATGAILGKSGKPEKIWLYPERDRKIANEAIWIESLFLLGHIIKVLGYCPVDFNDRGELQLAELFSMVKPKDQQRINPTSFGADELVKLITGANMSGKTFYLKALIFAVLCAQATGHAPAQAATMPLFDAVAYLDRVTAKSDRNLSAYGNELTFWKDFLTLLQGGGNIFACIDESFSTTSPRYQSSLTYAIAIEMLRHSQYMAIASHSHDALEALEKSNPELVKAYHFLTHLDEQGEIQFDYRLTPGHALSQALAVAKKLGLPDEIINLAASL